MRTSRYAWSIAGLLAGFAGLATSYAAAMVMTIREAPLVAVAELVIRLTPGPVAERVIRVFKHNDKAFLVAVILVILTAVFAWAGRLAERAWWKAALVFVTLGVIADIAVATSFRARWVDHVPIVIGFVTWLVALALLTAQLRSPWFSDERRGVATRRGFLIGAGAMAAASVGVAAVGRALGQGRRQVEESRRLLRLQSVTEPPVPDGASLGVKGITPWRTLPGDFYLIHTALIAPAIEPKDWSLRIHGMVDRPITLTYHDLIARRLTEDWITLNCVSNPVGGPLVGNAWWSGIRIAPLLAEAGVQAGADAVLQTSQDGWTCGTPLAALTDGRNAMLAVAMDGSPLEIDHGFPVRTVVPGLYGFVSACKWVVDWEVTTFGRFDAYWTERGWSEQAPVKMASRIDLPRAGAVVPSGSVRVGGVAWDQHIGIRAVEVALDGGAWQPAVIGDVGLPDSWVQWTAVLDVPSGDHLLKVRATNRQGEVQTGAVADVVPNGSTGWHTIRFSAQDA